MSKSPVALLFSPGVWSAFEIAKVPAGTAMVLCPPLTGIPHSGYGLPDGALAAMIASRREQPVPGELVSSVVVVTVSVPLGIAAANSGNASKATTTASEPRARVTHQH